MGLFGLAGAGLQFAGGLMANSSARSQARNANAMQFDLATRAHQYEVEDLKKAGLNPILSAHGGGASSPGMHAAPQSNPAEGASSALSNSAVTRAQIRNINQDTILKAAQAGSAEAATNLANVNSGYTASKADLIGLPAAAQRYILEQGVPVAAAGGRAVRAATNYVSHSAGSAVHKLRGFVRSKFGGN